ncbi:methyltransferase domain-containing protein [Hydrogenobacter thermophilus]|uniref:methyltransferase domain-containing protein n=1 Tax=Hydrogenobacter thermophilus TaxID=940 RepID=UPI0030FCC69A
MSILSLKFSRAFKTYDDWALPQKTSADVLVSMRTDCGLALDVGCGTGFASRGLKNVIGIDISKGMANIYKERFGKVILGKAEALPFKDRKFDLVVSNFSLHWTDIRRSIPEALRVSKKQVLLALPVEGSLREFGFPFPREDEIINLLKDVKVLDRFILDIEVPFRGWDLIRFFHYTGTSFNPLKGGVIMSKKRLEDMISRIDTPYFSVLFLSCEVKV